MREAARAQHVAEVHRGQQHVALPEQVRLIWSTVEASVAFSFTAPSVSPGGYSRLSSICSTNVKNVHLSEQRGMQESCSDG